MTEHTKEELYAIGKEVGLENGNLVELFKQHGIRPPFSEEKWNEYIKAIEYFKKTFCEICGARLIIDMQFKFGKNHHRCPKNKTHSVAHYTADLYQEFNECDRETALKAVQGETCKHNLQLLYCPPCMIKAKHIKLEMIRAEEQDEVQQG